MDWDNFNRPPCYVTIKVRQGKVQSASCKCGRPIMGRGKTAEQSAATHIKGWNAPYALEHVS